jgi:outer membrane protein OmpA-like peptidoglycan-associated protein
MQSCGTSSVVPQVLFALLLAVAPAHAATGDADNSQDYAGFARQPGFLITDFAEDNPAEADFPISHPLPLDANHVESVHVRGHRFIIRYQLAGGAPPTVYQTQLYYEKLAASGGFQVAKSGAVGDVTETFCRTMADHDIWVFLEPCNDVNVLTVVEAPRGSTPIPASEQAPLGPAPHGSEPVAPPPVPAPVTKVSLPTPPAPPMNPSASNTSPDVTTPPVTHLTAAAPAPHATATLTPKSVPAPPPAPAPAPTAPPAAAADSDALYNSLVVQGRIVVPLAFVPSRDTLAASSLPLIDRIVAMMKAHPDLAVRVEGHTDNAGDPDENMRLSAERAIAVQDRIIVGGIEAKRLDAVGVGGLQPIADNATAEGRDKNRRIELVVWKRLSHREAAPSPGA